MTDEELKLQVEEADVSDGWPADAKRFSLQSGQVVLTFVPMGRATYLWVGADDGEHYATFRGAALLAFVAALKNGLMQ